MPQAIHSFACLYVFPLCSHCLTKRETSYFSVFAGRKKTSIPITRSYFLPVESLILRAFFYSDQSKMRLTNLTKIF